MAQATPYSFTERKRIRKSFGKRESVLNVPYLLTMQQDSYVAFLQKDVPPAQRKPEGLQAAFLSAFPIVSHNGFVEMKFIEYNMAKPAFDTRECQQRGLTFASPLLLTQVPVLDVPLTTRLSLVLIVAGLLLFLCAALVQQWRGQA